MIQLAVGGRVHLDGGTVVTSLGPARAENSGWQRAGRSTLLPASIQASRQISRLPPYYFIADEAHRLIDAIDGERDRVLLRLLWEASIRISKAIAPDVRDVASDGIRIQGKGSVERVVFVQDGLVSAIPFYSQELSLERSACSFASCKGGHITKQRAD